SPRSCGFPAVRVPHPFSPCRAGKQGRPGRGANGRRRPPGPLPLRSPNARHDLLLVWSVRAGIGWRGGTARGRGEHVMQPPRVTPFRFGTVLSLLAASLCLAAPARAQAPARSTPGLVLNVDGRYATCDAIRFTPDGSRLLAIG